MLGVPSPEGPKLNQDQRAMLAFALKDAGMQLS